MPKLAAAMASWSYTTDWISIPSTSFSMLSPSLRTTFHRPSSKASLPVSKSNRREFWPLRRQRLMFQRRVSSSMTQPKLGNFCSASRLSRPVLIRLWRTIGVCWLTVSTSWEWFTNSENLRYQIFGHLVRLYLTSHQNFQPLLFLTLIESDIFILAFKYKLLLNQLPIL